MERDVPGAGRWLAASLALAAVALLARFVALESSPPGFYIDEAALAAHVICLRQTGADAWGQTWPLFSKAIELGFATPTYLYSAAVWTSLAGDSISAFRSHAALYSCVAALGAGALAWALFRRKDVACLALLCAALSPWGFQFARIAWDPALAPAFLVWGAALYLGSQRPSAAAASGALLALAMYSYPPTRVHAALVGGAMLALRPRLPGGRRAGATLALLAAGAIVALPLAVLTANGTLQGRFGMLSVFNPAYLQEHGGDTPLNAARIFLSNLLTHLSPAFLLGSGDGNLRHSTGSFGQLGWMEIAALAFVLPVVGSAPARDRGACAFLAFAFLAGFVAPSMTREGVPHALRAIGAWPFAPVLAAYAWAEAARRMPRLAPAAGLAVALAFSALFLRTYFLEYPARAAAWFDADVKRQAELARADSDWSRLVNDGAPYDPLALSYWRMSLGGEACSPLWRR